ncbi:MAG: MarR family winged helix-turn-helix transcriptional regulator [Clostridium sp.]
MIQKKAYIFGSIFFLDFKIQNEGDKLFTEITTKQWFLLLSIILSGVRNPTLTEVSKIIGYSRQNVKKLALHLEKACLIELHKDEKDNRALRITLTKRCFEYLESRKEKEERFIGKLFEGITDEEINVMCSTMEKLKNNLFERGEGNF